MSPGRPRVWWILHIVALLAWSACGRPQPAGHPYELQGQILAIRQEANEIASIPPATWSTALARPLEST